MHQMHISTIQVCDMFLNGNHIHAQIHVIVFVCGKTNFILVQSSICSRQINDVLSINNDTFHNHFHLTYPGELKIKDTT
jgi:hypothetical protein